MARVLERALRGRRLGREQCEDVVQETALRLLTAWPAVDPDRPLEPLALTIAMNLLRDEARAAARRERRPLPFSELSAHSVEEEALARIELERLAGALARLTPGQRDAVLGEVGESADLDRASAAVKMLRVRARRNLRSALGRASSVAPLAWRWMRGLAESIGVAAARANGLENAGALARPIAGVAWVAIAAGLAFGGPGVEGPRPDQTARVHSGREAVAPARVPAHAARSRGPRGSIAAARKSGTAARRTPAPVDAVAVAPSAPTSGQEPPATGPLPGAAPVGLPTFVDEVARGGPTLEPATLDVTIPGGLGDVAAR